MHKLPETVKLKVQLKPGIRNAINKLLYHEEEYMGDIKKYDSETGHATILIKKEFEERFKDKLLK